MSGQITIKYLQEYIKSKDYNPENTREYFIKLAEEVGELARAMHKDLRPESEGQIKNTIEEELWDVIYFTLAIANCYDIDVERIIPLKEAINNARYNPDIVFNPQL